MTANSQPIAPPPIQTRTRLGTGAVSVAGVDGRTHGGRRFREIVADLAHHMGGRPTAPQQAIIQRAAALAIWCEGQETALASGSP